MIMRLFFICLLVLSYSCQAQTGSKYKKLDTYFSELEKQNRFMGNVLIMKGSTVVYQNHVGYSDRANNKKLEEQSLFRIGSITKTFTATLVLKLVEKGKLSLDTKLSKFYPQIKGSDKITIRQMLNHSSGLANYTNQKDFGKYFSASQSSAKMLARITALKSDFEPGTKHEYSNTNFLLLGYIIEKVSGETYAAFLNSEILEPMGLLNIHYKLGKEILSNEAKSYVLQDGWQAVPDWNLDVAAGAGAIRSTAKDLALFSHHLFQGNILKEASLKEMKNFEDGYGLGLLKAPFYDKTAMMHGGKIEGFISKYFHVTEDDVSFIILCNANNFKQNDIAIALLSAFYGKEFSIPDLGEKKEIAVDVSTLKQYEGLYTAASFPLDIKVFEKETKLFAQATGQPAFPLKAVAKDEFTFSSAGITIKFLKTDKGFTQMKFDQAGLKVEFEKE